MTASALPFVTNLLAELPAPGKEECFETLCVGSGARVERIVSHWHASPPDFWYDQPHDEWVMLLQGEAVLAFEGDRQLALKPGDALLISAGCRHRVASTGEHTVWLAVHFASDQT